jgi:DNA-binding NarL/FixJ family response regulator
VATVLNVFIADDEELFRTGIEIVINAEEDMKVIGTAKNGLEAVQKLQIQSADIALIDIKMPVMNGIECIKKLRELGLSLPILILTTFNEEDYVIEGLAHGANGYLLKGINFNKLIKAIRNVADGQHLISPDVARKLANYLLERNSSKNESNLPSSLFSSTRFSPREKDVLQLLMQRLSNQEIAAKLFVSEGTVKNYLTTIYDKLQVKNRREAIQYLLKHQ